MSVCANRALNKYLDITLNFDWLVIVKLLQIIFMKLLQASLNETRFDLGMHVVEKGS